jgi:hypothetical protein
MAKERRGNLEAGVIVGLAASASLSTGQLRSGRVAQLAEQVTLNH